jgi:hypothetical protein
MYQMKAHVMPPLYFHGLVKGWWEGPAIIRKAFRSYILFTLKSVEEKVALLIYVMSRICVPCNPNTLNPDSD